jgi:hypothetical protein
MSDEQNSAAERGAQTHAMYEAATRQSAAGSINVGCSSVDGIDGEFVRARVIEVLQKHGSKFDCASEEHRTIKEVVRIFWSQVGEISALRAVNAEAVTKATDLMRRVEMARFALTAKE